MDHLAALAAAISAGKLPTTAQLNAAADWFLQSNLLSAEQATANSGGKLSEHGTVVLRDLRGIVEAYKTVGAEKNGDDLVQDAMWNLGQAQLEAKGAGEDSEATTDASNFAGAIKELVNIAIMHVTGESGDLMGEFAGFSRSTMADVAEAVEKQAAGAKDNLRHTQGEVEEGKRDSLGRTKEEGEADADAKVKWEKNMDTVKVAGSKVIGTGQETRDSVKDVSGRASDRMDDALWRICNRAQKDQNYHNAIATLFDLAHKWVYRSADRASATAQSTPTDTPPSDAFADFIPDPSGRIPHALRNLRTVAERFAGGKSLDDLFTAAARCAADLNEDEHLNTWFNNWETYARKCLDEPGYLRSDACAERRNELTQRWGEIMDEDTPVARKWKTDYGELQAQGGAFAQAVQQDGAWQRLSEAHNVLGRHLMDAGPDAMQAAVGQAGWVWSDLMDVWMPRLFGLVKEIPLPRTEYVDEEVEFVFENLDISSLQILPGHFHITSTTDVDIDAPSSAEKTRDISSTNKIKLTGVQLAFKNASFYYRDKGMKPVKEVSGLLDLSLPEKGVDVDISLGLLPTTSGTEERAQRGGFHRVDSVNVNLHDVGLSIKQSNHQLLISVFKPVVRSRLVATLKSTMEAYIRTALEFIDHTMYDTHRRARVFADAGAPTPAAYLSGFVSEVGFLAQQASVLAGVRATSVGIIKDDPNSDKAFAVGSAPQILPAEKHGPAASGTHGGPGAQAAGGNGPQGQDATSSFGSTVAKKREVEVATDGWKSDAYNL